MITDAKSRFTVVGWDERGEALYGNATSKTNYSDRWFVYICSTCRTETGFEKKDLITHVGTGHSNLLESDQNSVERELASYLTSENSFVDFYCSGCGKAVRAYYLYEPYEDRRGDSLKLKTVAEVSPSAKSAAKTRDRENFWRIRRWKSRKLAFSGVA